MGESCRWNGCPWGPGHEGPHRLGWTGPQLRAFRIERAGRLWHVAARSRSEAGGCAIRSLEILGDLPWRGPRSLRGLRIVRAPERDVEAAALGRPGALLSRYRVVGVARA